MKCIAISKCHWSIFASYFKWLRRIQVKSFQEKHSCYMSFKNKMVNVATIVDHSEAIVKDHSNMTLKEIQKRVSSE